MIQNFFFNSEIEAKDLGGGVTRKVLSYNKNLMVCELTFEVGAVGVPHKHFHEQCGYIVEGKMEFEIDGVKRVLGPGDSAYKQPYVLHGAVCVEKAKILDIFTPQREDLLD